MSSLKAPSQAQSIECEYLQTYEGHKDGVWEVSTSHSMPTVLGTASAGTVLVIYRVSHCMTNLNLFSATGRLIALT